MPRHHHHPHPQPHHHHGEQFDAGDCAFFHKVLEAEIGEPAATYCGRILEGVVPPDQRARSEMGLLEIKKIRSLLGPAKTPAPFTYLVPDEGNWVWSDTHYALLPTTAKDVTSSFALDDRAVKIADWLGRGPAHHRLQSLICLVRAAMLDELLESKVMNKPQGDGDG